MSFFDKFAICIFDVLWFWIDGNWSLKKIRLFMYPLLQKKGSMCIGAYSPTHFPVFSQWWKCRLKVGRVPAAISARINSVQGPSGEGHEHREKRNYICDSF